MSSERDSQEIESKIGLGQSNDEAKNDFFLSEDGLQRIVESQRQYRREQARQRRYEHSLISWFFDEFPSDDFYRLPLRERRNTRQEMMYHRFRQMISWSFWSRMKSSTGIKLVAVGGLATAFLQAAPIFNSPDAPTLPLSWLLLGAVFYLLAVIWFEVRCPALLKRTLAGSEQYLGIEGRRWLLALVEDELRRWWSIKPYDMQIGAYQPESNSYVMAGAIIQYGDIPVYDGFCDYASMRIERALSEYSELTSSTIWRSEFKTDEYQKFSPVRSISPANAPLRRFHLSVFNSYDVEMGKVGQEGDLVLRWIEGSVTFLSMSEKPRNLTISGYAEGLLYLFQSDASALTFTRIIAQWQNTKRPWSRLLLIGLFIASGSCFVWFLFLLMRVLTPALL